MSNTPLSLSRRHVLGDLYGRCDSLNESIPVYLAGDEPVLLGHADESLGHYADAFSFHIADEHCKKLSAGQFTYGFEYDYSDPEATGRSSRVKLTSIILTGRKAYQKPGPKSAETKEAAVEEAPATEKA